MKRDAEQALGGIKVSSQTKKHDLRGYLQGCLCSLQYDVMRSKLPVCRSQRLSEQQVWHHRFSERKYRQQEDGEDEAVRWKSSSDKAQKGWLIDRYKVNETFHTISPGYPWIRRSLTSPSSTEDDTLQQFCLNEGRKSKKGRVEDAV